MNILITTSYYTPNLSGFSLYVERLAQVLISLGHHVTVLTNRHDLRSPRHESHPHLDTIRLPVHFYLSKSPVSLYFPFALLRQLVRSDLVITNLPGLEPPFVSFLTRLMAKPVLTIHHCDPVVPGRLGPLFTLLANLASLTTCVFSTRLITYTLDYAIHSPVLRYFLPKTSALLPPISTPIASPAKVREMRKRITPQGLTIGFAGRIAADKGLDILLAAVPHLEASLPVFKIALAGPTRPVGETTYTRLKKEIRKHSKHLVFLGPVPPGDMGSFYACIDLLVLPSINRTESFGMVQIEAILSGVPVIASDLPGVRQTVLLTHSGLLVPPSDPISLARAIISVYRKSTKLPPRNLSKFSPSSFTKNLTNILSGSIRS